ncbi:MAG TPA: hypothetical protein VF194_01830 [Ferrovibrio sp.]|uniref:hypothetical protein n=1 Tax=Ferrovibrio sp. TaxID=1917215 RepID=UPI002ED6622D
MILLRRVSFLAAVLLPLIGSHTVLAADEEVHWSAIAPQDRQVQWQAQDLAASPHMAESFTAPLGYRIERYFWRAQKPAGAFAIVVLRDLTGDDHYLSGPVDLMKFARTVLKGLEAPSPKALDDKDHERQTPAGPAETRRFELGARECLAVGFYAAPEGKAPAKGHALTEGSLRLDGVYCASAGEKMTEERAKATAGALRLGQADEADSSATK